jgi:formate hydrogenlyase subunit 4
MSVLLAIGGMLVQAMLAPLFAVVLVGLEARFAGRLAGGGAAPVLLPWRALRGAFARQRVRGEGGSLLTSAGPVLVFAATWGAASMVPVAGGGGDVLVVAGLLVLARIVAGGAEDRVALVAEPALMMALLVRGLPGGGAAGPIGVAALGLVVLVLAGRGEVAATASGGDLALLRLAAALRRLVLFGLVVGQIVPTMREGFEWTLVAVALTAGGIGMLAAGVALARAGLSALRPERRREALEACVALAVLAVLVGLLEAGS